MDLKKVWLMRATTTFPLQVAQKNVVKPLASFSSRIRVRRKTLRSYLRLMLRLSNASVSAMLISSTLAKVSSLSKTKGRWLKTLNVKKKR